MSSWTSLTSWCPSEFRDTEGELRYLTLNLIHISFINVKPYFEIELWLRMPTSEFGEFKVQRPRLRFYLWGRLFATVLHCPGIWAVLSLDKCGPFRVSPQTAWREGLAGLPQSWGLASLSSLSSASICCCKINIDCSSSFCLKYVKKIYL